MLVSNMGQGGEVGLDIHRARSPRSKSLAAITAHKSKKRKVEATDTNGDSVNTTPPDDEKSTGMIQFDITHIPLFPKHTGF